jgi:plasmid stabilization system protein ParE
MTRWLVSLDAADDLETLVDFLVSDMPEHAVQTVDLIMDGLNILQDHPNIGRPLQLPLRELVISRGRTGYVALYEYDAQADVVVVLAIRHQRQAGYS